MGGAASPSPPWSRCPRARRAAPPSSTAAASGAPGWSPTEGPSWAWARLLLAEAQAELLELGLHLVDRLLAEVPDVHQLGLRLLHEVAHGVDALALQAVVGADREVQVLDRDRVVARLVLVLCRTDRDAGRLGQGGGELNELEQRAAGGGQGLARRHRPVRLDVQDQAVAVGHLPHAGVLDGVGDLADRREDRVD